MKDAGEVESRSPPPRSSGDWEDERQQGLGELAVAPVLLLRLLLPQVTLCFQEEKEPR